MQLVTADALLLEVYNLHDRDRIATFLTSDHGKKRGVARGARRKYSRFSGQLQPLAKVRVTWFEKESRDLARISDLELLRPAQALQKSLEGILLGSYLAEQMSVFAQENEESDALFRLLDSTLEALLDGIDQGLAARYYEAWILRLGGIFPPPRECPLCGREFAQERPALLPSGGDALVCGECAHGAGRSLRVSPAALDFLHRIGRASLRKMSQTAPAPRTLREIEELCGRIRRPFLGHELKSYEVMRRTLQEVGE